MRKFIEEAADACDRAGKRKHRDGSGRLCWQGERLELTYSPGESYHHHGRRYINEHLNLYSRAAHCEPKPARELRRRFVERHIGKSYSEAKVPRSAGQWALLIAGVEHLDAALSREWDGWLAEGRSAEEEEARRQEEAERQRQARLRLERLAPRMLHILRNVATIVRSPSISEERRAGLQRDITDVLAEAEGLKEPAGT